MGGASTSHGTRDTTSSGEILLSCLESKVNSKIRIGLTGSWSMLTTRTTSFSWETIPGSKFNAVTPCVLNGHLRFSFFQGVRELRAKHQDSVLERGSSDELRQSGQRSVGS